MLSNYQLICLPSSKIIADDESAPGYWEMTFWGKGLCESCESAWGYLEMGFWGSDSVNADSGSSGQILVWRERLKTHDNRTPFLSSWDCSSEQGTQISIQKLNRLRSISSERTARRDMACRSLRFSYRRGDVADGLLVCGIALGFLRRISLPWT